MHCLRKSCTAAVGRIKVDTAYSGRAASACKHSTTRRAVHVDGLQYHIHGLCEWVNECIHVCIFIGVHAYIHSPYYPCVQEKSFF